jgi:serine/threonine-protein kinase
MSNAQTHGRVGAYEIVSLIGVGGMGEVYRARDPNLGRDVALKVLPPELATDRERMARFAREAQVLASLNHPGIATIHGFEKGAIIMELVEGPTLAERLAAGPLPLPEAMHIARQIAEALEYAHERGIVHRDLKPANLFLAKRPDGSHRIKVLDFGISKSLTDSSLNAMRLTSTTTLIGSPLYMSPEQMQSMAG